MKVRITDIDSGESRVVSSIHDCAKYLDRSGYSASLRHGTIIMGHVLFEPLPQASQTAGGNKKGEA